MSEFSHRHCDDAAPVKHILGDAQLETKLKMFPLLFLRFYSEALPISVNSVGHWTCPGLPLLLAMPQTPSVCVLLKEERLASLCSTVENCSVWKMKALHGHGDVVLPRVNRTPTPVTCDPVLNAHAYRGVLWSVME